MLVDIATGGLWDDKPFSNPITRAGDAISDYVRDELAPIYREIPIKHLTLMTSQVGSLVKFLVLLVLFLL